MRDLKRYSYECFMQNKEPEGTIEKIYYFIWKKVNLPLSPSSGYIKFGKYLNNDMQKGFEEGKIKEE